MKCQDQGQRAKSRPADLIVICCHLVLLNIFLRLGSVVLATDRGGGGGGVLERIQFFIKVFLQFSKE